MASLVAGGSDLVHVVPEQTEARQVWPESSDFQFPCAARETEPAQLFAMASLLRHCVGEGELIDRGTVLSDVGSCPRIGVGLAGTSAEPGRVAEVAGQEQVEADARPCQIRARTNGGDEHSARQGPVDVAPALRDLCAMS